MVDIQQLESRFGAKKSLLVRVLEAFLSDSSGLIPQVAVADPKGLHKLKGITREICDLKTSELAARIEGVLKDNKTPSPEEIGALIQSFEETAAEVRILIKELQGGV